MGLKGNSLILSAPVKRKLHAARPGMLPFSPETCAAGNTWFGSRCLSCRGKLFKQQIMPV
jgi:hypothetical protein